MDFEYPEDLKYFAKVFSNGNIKQFESAYKDYFDFRPPLVKRKEFNLIRNKVFKELCAKHGMECQLKLLKTCSVNCNFAVDHFIPLSSNILNKELRKMKAAKGRKVKTQSFGSNNPKNFVLACANCNAFKKHRIMNVKNS